MRAFGILVIGLAGVVGACSGGESATTAPVPPEPVVECLGVPAATCQEIVSGARNDAPPGAVPMTIRAACTLALCTVQNGEVEIEVRYSNGETHTSGMGWAGADEPGIDQPGPVEPAVPGEPICLGVPVQTCRDLAASAASADTQGREVATITVRCRAVPCTTTTGSGDTVVLFVDDTSVTTEWSYENATPSG